MLRISTMPLLKNGPSMEPLSEFTGVPVSSGLNAGTITNCPGHESYLSLTRSSASLALAQHFSVLLVPSESTISR